VPVLRYAMLTVSDRVNRHRRDPPGRLIAQVKDHAMIAAEPFGQTSLLPAALVGRAQERNRLREALGNLLTGRGGLVLIDGDIGSGKTTLMRALARNAAERGVLTALGRCYDRGDGPPYSLWRDLFAHWGPQQQPDAGPGPTPGLLLTYAATTRSARSLFEHDPPPPPDVAPAQGERVPYTLAAQVREALADAANGPLLILLDDLHWADPESLELLRGLARGLADIRILIVATYRDQAAARRPPLATLLSTLAREADPVRLHLAPLSGETLRTLLWARYGLTPGDEDRLHAYLRALAEGNPLFINELLRACETRGLLRRAAHHGREWMLEDLGRFGIPPLVGQVFDGQIAPLGAEAVRLLSIAALLGREVPLTLWAEVAGVAEERLLEVLDRAVEADLVTETPHGEGLRFRHALIRETLYQRQSAARRRAWHRRAGEALAHTRGTPTQATVDAAAAHFTEAGDPRALDWRTRAGERALQAGDWQGAIGHFTAALALLQDGTNESARGWLLYRLGRLHRYGDVSAGLERLAEAEEIAIARGDRALLVLTAASRAVLRTLRGQLHWGLTELEPALRDWETLTPAEFAEPRRQGVEPFEAPPWGTYALLLAIAGRFDAARPIATRIVAAPPPISPGNRLEGFPWWDATLGLGLVQMARGDFPAARAAIGQARATYRTAAHQHLSGLSAFGELDAALRYATDDLTRRAQLVAEAEEAYRPTDGAQGAAVARAARLPLLLIEGRWAEARELARAAPAHDDDHHLRDVAVAVSLGNLARAQGDAVTAWHIVARQLPSGLATPPGDAPFIETLALLELASELALDAHDLPTMRSWLDVHDRWLAWGDTIIGVSAGHLAWGRHARASNDLAQARARGAAALATAREPRQPLAALAAERFLGELALVDGRFEVAAGHIAAAIALADACAVPYERALSLVALAELGLARAASVGDDPPPPGPCRRRDWPSTRSRRSAPRWARSRSWHGATRSPPDSIP